MDVLGGRKTGGYIEGEIRICGHPKRQQTFARISGYCEQNDIHSPQVTVKESIVYSAWLRLPPEIGKETREVNALMVPSKTKTQRAKLLRFVGTW
jgi:ABC-type multidrug transport system ATPase subunit